ncbi:MAG: lamin tail domain-containing protein [Deltaproteobacteria bacterium]|nr:lamin tail domain-containing protein [Deltaproteobacteria bacterium]
MTSRFSLAGTSAAVCLAALACGCAPQPSSDMGRLPAVLPQLQLPITLAVPGDYTTAAAALAAASPGDVVSLGAGIWNEDLTVPGGVILQGQGWQETFVAGEITVSSGQAAVRFVTVEGPGLSGGNCGVAVGAGDSVVLEASRVRNWFKGVCLDAGASAPLASVLDRNTFRSNGDAVVVTSGSVSLWSNYFNYNLRSGAYGLDGASIDAINNTFFGNSFGGSAANRDASLSLGSGTSTVQNNNLTGNAVGLDCDGCTVVAATNNIWGNTTNYAGDSAAAPTDLSVDPLFVNLTSDDLRLLPGSPLIDAGTASGAPSNDWDGLPRPYGAGWDIGADEWSASGLSVVINEVMANPLVESTGEYIELANVGSAPVDIAGLVLSDGDGDEVIEAWLGGSTVIPGGGYAVVLDPGYAGNYTIPAATLVTIGTPSIGNGLSTNDPIQLMEATGSVVIDEWTVPFDPGNGTSAERVDVLSGNLPANWVASPCSSGSSPGALNCAAGTIAPNDPSVLVMTEVLANALNEQNGEFVELWNSGSEAVNLAGLVISDDDSTDGLVAWGSGDTILAAGGRALIVDPNYAGQYLVPDSVLLVTTPDATIGNGLANGTDPATLYDIDGTTVIDSFTFPTDPGNGISIEKLDPSVGDVASNWVASPCAEGHSAGRLACAAGGVGSGLVLNEVLANPLNEQTGEYLELLNLTGGPVDLAGLWISDGDTSEPLVARNGGPTVLADGDLALVLDSGYDDNYALPSGVVTVTTADNHLGNSLSVSDPITLLESDGLSVIDAYLAPFNPGNGTSAEKLAALGGDVAGNWLPSTCGGGGSPGAINCVSGGSGTGGPGGLSLSEVMANPLSEATGEYVEVFNGGTTPVDLAGLILDDGDAADEVVAYNAGTTVLAAGAYGLILDTGYAGQYAIPAGVTTVTVDDAALGSGLATNDSVTLFDTDGAAVIDSYSSPFNPGNGTSVEKLDIAVGDLPANWVASPCTASPGTANCASGAALVACADGFDNDGDGWVDLADPGCASAADTDESMVGPDECGDEADNDGDGFIDGLDPECASPTGDSEAGPCADGADNDGDGWVDLDDPDCPGAGDELGFSTAQCNDGVDNDGDGDIDSADADCSDGATISESVGCSDGVDNDGDSWTDSADPDCASAPFVESGTGTAECNDGIDNNGDGLVDGDDPECSSATSSEPLPYFFLVVGEIMADPQAVPDSQGEWFELYNTLSVPVELEDWTIYDGGGDSFDINGSLVIPALGYLVFGNNGNLATNGGVNVDYVYSGFELDNIDDEIYIDDWTATETFALEYWTLSGWPLTPGASMSVTGATAPSLSTYWYPVNWCASTTAWAGSAGDLGSPGLPNEVCP